MTEIACSSIGTAHRRSSSAALKRFITYEQVSVSSRYTLPPGGSEHAFLQREILDPLHEVVRRHRPLGEICVPAARARRQDDLLAFAMHVDLTHRELEFLREPNRLTAVVHEEPGDAFSFHASAHLE